MGTSEIVITGHVSMRPVSVIPNLAVTTLLLPILVVVFCSLGSSKPQLRTGDDRLVQALFDDDVNVVRAYLSRGISPNARDSNGRTLLTIASNNGSLRSMKLLLDKGANVNLRCEDGETPLMRAVGSLYRSGIDSVRLLVTRGANVNLAMPEGTTPLMMASAPASYRYEETYAEAVRLLLKKGAKVNARNRKGYTALRVAREADARVIVAILRKAGAKS